MSFLRVVFGAVANEPALIALPNHIIGRHCKLLLFALFIYHKIFIALFYAIPKIPLITEETHLPLASYSLHQHIDVGKNLFASRPAAHICICLCQLILHQVNMFASCGIGKFPQFVQELHRFILREVLSAEEGLGNQERFRCLDGKLCHIVTPLRTAFLYGYIIAAIFSPSIYLPTDCAYGQSFILAGEREPAFTDILSQLLCIFDMTLVRFCKCIQQERNHFAGIFRFIFRLLRAEKFQPCLTLPPDIREGLVVVSRGEGIVHDTGTSCVFREKLHFSIRIATGNFRNVIYIVLVKADDIVIHGIIGGSELCGLMLFEGYLVLFEDGLRFAGYILAERSPATGRGHGKLLAKSGLFYQILHYILSHRRAAGIPRANK